MRFRTFVTERRDRRFAIKRRIRPKIFPMHLVLCSLVCFTDRCEQHADQMQMPRDERQLRAEDVLEDGTRFQARRKNPQGEVQVRRTRRPDESRQRNAQTNQLVSFIVIYIFFSK